MEEYFQTQSCNKLKGQGCCQECAKCCWVFLATAALFGRNMAVSKVGGDLFANPALSGLFEAMAGISPGVPKPFECTGTELEVRSAIVAAGQQRGDLSALESCLRDPMVTAARPLEVVLKDWGQDDLMPVPLRELVQRAVSL